MWRFAALASAFLGWALAPAPASAQAPAAWGGVYLGGSAGAAWSRSAFGTTTVCGPTVYFRCANLAPVQNAWSGGRSTTSALASLHAGYLVQSGAFVAGVEADFGIWSLRGRLNGGGRYVAPAVAVGVPFTTSASTSANWLATLRGRAGWAFGDVLIYATGGLALSDIKVRNAFLDAIPIQFGLGEGSGSSTRLGWTLGGGGEWRFAPGWSVRAEYLYVDFGSRRARGRVFDVTLPADFTSPTSTSARVNAHIARIGLSRQF